MEDFKKSYNSLDWKNILSSCATLGIFSLAYGGYRCFMYGWSVSKLLRPTFDITFPYFLYRVSYENITISKPSIRSMENSIISGIFSGLIYGGFNISLSGNSPFASKKLKNFVLLGAGLGFLLEMGRVLSFHFLEYKERKEREHDEKADRLFMEQYEKYGEAAFKRRKFALEPSILPKWFPLRPITEQEYREKLENRLLALKVRHRIHQEQQQQKQQEPPKQTE